MNKGFTLFIAIVTTGTLLLVATGIIGLAVKSSKIYSAARESQNAFYAADTGVECALYWDVSNPTGFSAFSTSTSSEIICNDQTITVGGDSPSEFTFDFSPDPYCTRVVVTKSADNSTQIQSFGYNTCDSSNPRRVERAVKVTY